MIQGEKINEGKIQERKMQERKMQGGKINGEKTDRINNSSKILIALLPLLLLVAGNCFAAGDSSRSDKQGESIKSHALALYGKPKYGANFKHFSYVNPNAPKRGQLTRGGFGTFDSLNMFILQGNSADGLGLIYDTLTSKGMEEPVTEYGLLAEQIEIPKGEIDWIIFHLNKKAKFSDGVAVTAEDVVFSFETIITKAIPQYRAYYADVVKAEALDKHRVKFTFKHSNNKELPLILGQLVVLPKHYWEAKDRDFTKVSLEPPVGSGAYVIDSVKPGRSITYKRNDKYWGKDLPVNKGLHNFDKIKYVYYRDLEILHEGFKSGEIDLKVENQASRWKKEYDFPAVKSGKVVKKEFKHNRNQGMQAFIFNTRREIFKDAKVREALNYAFDFEWANKNLFFSSYKRSYSFFSNSELAAKGKPTAGELKILEPYKNRLPKQIWGDVPSQPRSDTAGGIRANLRQAISLLKEGGWELKDGKLMSKDSGKQMKFEILIVQKAFERIVNPFIKNLERLGIDASVRLVDTTQYINRIQEFNFDMIVFSFAQSESPGNEQRDFWGSASASHAGSRNLVGIMDPVIDELIEGLITVSSRDELISYSQVLDRVMLAGYYVIPHWHISADRIAYWNKFGFTNVVPDSGVQVTSWWAK